MILKQNAELRVKVPNFHAKKVFSSLQESMQQLFKNEDHADHCFLYSWKVYYENVLAYHTVNAKFYVEVSMSLHEHVYTHNLNFG